MGEVTGQVAIVTGASRGLGRAIALRLAADGVRVMVCARDEAACEAVAGDIRERGGEASACACDVADAGAVARMVEQTRAKFGRIDIVINNAGMIEPIGHIADCDPAIWGRAVTVNLTGAFHVLHAALPALVAAEGVVIDIGSGAAKRPQEGWSAYCSAKAGLAMLTRCIAHEYGEKGVRAYGLAPGVVDTEMQGVIRASGMNPVSRLRRSDLAPPEAPAEVVAWLCRERPADLSGEDLDVRDPGLQSRVAAA